MKTLLALVLALAPSLALAQGGAEQGRNTSVTLGSPLLNGQDLTATRGFVLVTPLDGYDGLTLDFKVTDANNSVTSLTTKCFTTVPDFESKITIVDSTQCATDTITVQVNGTSYALVEATDWNKGASNTAAALSLATKIGQTVNMTPVQSAAVINMLPKSGVQSYYLYTSDTNCATVQNAAALGGQLDECVLTPGACTYKYSTWVADNAAGDPLAVSASKRWPERIGISWYSKLYCTVEVGGAGASIDKIYVWGRLAVGE